MDNQNDQNSASNPIFPPAAGGGGSTPSFEPPAAPPQDPGNPPPPVPSPFDTQPPAPPPPPPVPTAGAIPNWPPTPNLTSTWIPPVQTPPQSEPTPIQSEPTSTFIPAQPAPSAGSEPTLSPLDNPWGAPTQPPPIAQSPSPTQPSWTSVPESAPTDLSHLISNNNSEQAPTLPASETLVVPSGTAVTPEVPTIATENHKGIPRWLIGLGVGLLILVLGISAYFILGIGQFSKTPASLPATTVSQTTVKPPPPIAIPSAQPTPAAATGSANFGQLQGSGTRTATRAGDLIPQR